MGEINLINYVNNSSQESVDNVYAANNNQHLFAEFNKNVNKIVVEVKETPKKLTLKKNK